MTDIQILLERADRADGVLDTLDFLDVARPLVRELRDALRAAQDEIQDLKYQYSMDFASGGGRHSSAWHVREILKKENATLRKRLEAAEAELNGIRDYAGHHDRCPDKSYSVGVPTFCNCGWNKFRETWRKLKEGGEG